ncbi:hypothetical protein BD779DRAFT_1802750 [Infundibulicybe gibba]|nr:hypothetical protein BD779DRAFT_1802750 [Infundibulicybe gibba]
MAMHYTDQDHPMASPISTRGSPIAHDPLLAVATEKRRYESLAEQFGILVLIATFTAGLIIAFMSLARDVINPDKSTRQHFDVGTLLALFATGTQLGTVIVAGRGAALCFRQAVYYSGKPPSDDGNSVKDFRHYFFICEQLQLFGTFLFFASILFFVFFMFEHIRYPIIFYVACGLGACAVYQTGFWKASMLRQDFLIMSESFRKFAGSKV